MHASASVWALTSAPHCALPAHRAHAAEGIAHPTTHRSTRRSHPGVAGGVAGEGGEDGGRCGGGESGGDGGTGGGAAGGDEGGAEGGCRCKQQVRAQYDCAQRSSRQAPAREPPSRSAPHCALRAHSSHAADGEAHSTCQRSTTCSHPGGGAGSGSGGGGPGGDTCGGGAGDGPGGGGKSGGAGGATGGCGGLRTTDSTSMTDRSGGVRLRLGVEMMSIGAKGRPELIDSTAWRDRP